MVRGLILRLIGWKSKVLFPARLVGNQRSYSQPVWLDVRGLILSKVDWKPEVLCSAKLVGTQRSYSQPDVWATLVGNEVLFDSSLVGNQKSYFQPAVWASLFPEPKRALVGPNC